MSLVVYIYNYVHRPTGLSSRFNTELQDVILVNMKEYTLLLSIPVIPNRNSILIQENHTKENDVQPIYLITLKDETY